MAPSPSGSISVPPPLSGVVIAQFVLGAVCDSVLVLGRGPSSPATADRDVSSIEIVIARFSAAHDTLRHSSPSFVLP